MGSVSALPTQAPRLSSITLSNDYGSCSMVPPNSAMRTALVRKNKLVDMINKPKLHSKP